MEVQVYQRYCFGPFVLDPVEKVLLREGRPLCLPPKAIETLLVLVERAGHLIEKTELLERVWPDTFVEETTVAQNIFTLRKALNGSPGDSQYIETVPKRGYRFVATVELLDVQDDSRPSSSNRAAEKRFPQRLLLSAIAVVLLALATGIYLGGRSRSTVAGLPAGTITLAVLPFENFTADPAQDSLSEGLTEEMIAQLSRLNPEHLRVIARTTAMQYKGTHKTVAQIGRELGADYILESSFRREGDRARITTQLVRTNDQTHLWSQQYERGVREILPLESEVAQAIAHEIAVKLSPQQRASLAAHQAVDPQAHQLYLQGRYFWNKRTEQGHLKAIEYFNQAVAADSQYAEAYSGLADAYALLGSNPTTAITRRDAIAKARGAALQALSIDETLAEAHTSLAFIYWHYDWNWPAAEKEFQRALQLNPSYPTTHHWYAYYLVSQSRTDQALEEIRRAQEMDPLSLIINTDVAEVLYYGRQYEQAIEQAKKVLEMDPDFALARVMLAWCYLAKKQYGTALEESEKGISIQGAKFYLEANLAAIHAMMGQTSMARDLLQQLESESEHQHQGQLFMGIAQVHATLGEKDQAFVWLEKAFQNRDGGLTLIKEIPYLDSIHTDPRFANLVQRIGLPS